MEIIGYFASILIGVSLGLIGGGGSILTVPVLVYLFGVEAGQATVYSLFIVGTTSIAGSLSYFKDRLINLKTVFVFGIPSIFSVFLTRMFIIPAIPQYLFHIGGITITKDILLLLLFAVLMIVASYNMIKSKLPEDKDQGQAMNYPIVILEGFFVGMLTGLVGAGGGFLIIPALIHFLKLPMKSAIGTSLVIISINSLSGFVFSLSTIAIDWKLIFSITAIAVIGILVGSSVSHKIDGKKLKSAFGWFVLAMGIYIIIKEFFIH